jgi:hypothetical protein
MTTSPCSRERTLAGRFDPGEINGKPDGGTGLPICVWWG